MESIVFLIIGLIGLALGAHLIVRGAENISNFFKISSLFIGLTIASIGTSIPEMAVSITGAKDRLQGLETSGIVVGNALGSALTQITLILGIIALLGALYIKKRELNRDGGMLFASMIILFIMFIDLKLTQFEGALLVIIYLIYFFNLIREEHVYDKIRGRRPEMHTLYDISAIIIGLVLVMYAAELVVTNGVITAEMFNIPTYLIGIFIVGLGTSLPELAISLYALSKRAIGLSVGNLIGSNITDIMLSLGLGTAISGFVINPNILYFDILFLLGVTGLMLILFRTRYRMEKREGAVLVAAYIFYLALKLYGF